FSCFGYAFLTSSRKSFSNSALSVSLSALRYGRRPVPLYHSRILSCDAILWQYTVSQIVKSDEAAARISKYSSCVSVYKIRGSSNLSLHFLLFVSSPIIV